MLQNNNVRIMLYDRQLCEGKHLLDEEGEYIINHETNFIELDSTKICRIDDVKKLSWWKRSFNKF